VTISILPAAGLGIAVHPHCQALDGHVECYWSLAIESPPRTVQLVPDGLVDLVFDQANRRVFVCGPCDQPATYTHQQACDLLGVSLRPGTARAVLGVPANTLLSEWQPLAEVIGAVADELGALVFQAPSLRNRLPILDAFLLARIYAIAFEPRIERAVREILEHDGTIEVSEVGKRAGASSRNLGRLFDAWVGMSPKRFLRVVRLQAAIRRLVESDVELAAIALEAGYADQAHLSREIRVLTGLRPKDLARRLSDSFKK
jgi:AraC-like DNA-binding protein